VGSGKTRWPSSVLRKVWPHLEKLTDSFQSFDDLLSIGLLVVVGPGRAAANQANPRFARVRSLLQPYEIVQFFQGEGLNTLSTELGNWGRMMGGHA
jgi:origin recognition complex subunit 4